MTPKTITVIRCVAGAVRCNFKQNSGYGFVVCGNPKPVDSYGNPCPSIKTIKILED